MKILLVQNSFLGDVVLSTPLISAIHKLHPGCELWMMTTPLAQDLVKRDPLVAGVIPFDKRGAMSGIGGIFKFSSLVKSHGFDRVYSLHRALRTTLVLWLSGVRHRVGFKKARLSFLYHERADRPQDLHDVLRNLSLLQSVAPRESFDGGLRLFAPSREQLSDRVRSILDAHPRRVIVVPGSEWHTKRWSWKGYRDVVQHFEKLGFSVLALGAPKERSICAQVGEGTGMINLAGETTLGESLAVVQGASLLVCNDSMMLHVASAFKVPNIAVFCATSPSFGFGPWQNRALVVEKEGLSCKPCRRHGSRVCPTGTESCMNDLPGSTVIAAAESLLSRDGGLVS